MCLFGPLRHLWEERIRGTISGETLLTALFECTDSSYCRQGHVTQLIIDGFEIVYLVRDSETKRGDLTMLSQFGTRRRFLATLLFTMWDSMCVSLDKEIFNPNYSLFTSTEARRLHIPAEPKQQY
jgi:hypothetical protein